MRICGGTVMILTSGTCRPGPRRRAATYLLFLGTALMVTVIGLSSLMAVRIQRRASQGSDHFAAARFCAQAGIELGFYMIHSDPDWRKNLGEGEWLSDEPIGNGKVTLGASFEKGGGSDDGPVTLTATATYGLACYILEVTAEPFAGGMVVTPGSWRQQVN